MQLCEICRRGKSASVLRVCAECLRSGLGEELVKKAHRRVRERYGLPAEPPRERRERGSGEEGAERESGGRGVVKCKICANECELREGERGYCGLRMNIGGSLRFLASPTRFSHATGAETEGSEWGSRENAGLFYAYYDALPTNCCAAWFCPGSAQRNKVNLAVFFYGCNFNCLFCQNATHKDLSRASRHTVSDFVALASRQDVYCVCFFGGSPEPQLPFAIRASESIEGVRICWEWNGCGNRSLVRKAAEISLRSGGIVKFDLKAFDPHLSEALCGVPNKRAYENFEMIAREFFEGSDPPVLTATTLLVPFYVDEIEVSRIAEFIASINDEIPYSLLVFHPDFYMRDLPITPKSQVKRCYEAAKRYLKHVNIGNKHLLAFAE